MTKKPFQFLSPGDTIEWTGDVGVVRPAFFQKKRTKKELFDWVFVTNKLSTQQVFRSILELSKSA